MIVSFLCAELLLLLTRQRDIIKLFKKDRQRTKGEKYEIEHGLRRALMLEAILFVPASVTLFRLTLFSPIYSRLSQINPDPFWCYAIMGVVAYGFPFASVRNFVKGVALSTLKQYVQLTNKSERELFQKHQGPESPNVLPEEENSYEGN